MEENAKYCGKGNVNETAGIISTPMYAVWNNPRLESAQTEF
jgi:hypothetical protein